MYIALDLIHNYSIVNPDNPREWVQVFKSIKPQQCRLLTYRVTNDSIFFETTKCVLENGGWLKYSFSGKRTKLGIKGILHSQWCSHFDSTKVFPEKSKIELIESK